MSISSGIRARALASSAAEVDSCGEASTFYAEGEVYGEMAMSTAGDGQVRGAAAGEIIIVTVATVYAATVVEAMDAS